MLKNIRLLAWLGHCEMKMKPGFKFGSFTSVAALLCCSLVSYSECSAIGFYHTSGVIGVLSTIFAGMFHFNKMISLKFLPINICFHI